MNLTGGIVLFATIWFLVFYVVLQLRTRPQGDDGEVVPGTPAGAPAKEDVGRSAAIATLFATLLWGGIAGVILSGKVSLDDFNVFGLHPPGQGPSD